MGSCMRLKALREERHLTQQYIAAILGTTPQYYQKYESGAHQISVDRLEILADYYETSTDYILGRTSEKRPYPPALP